MSSASVCPARIELSKLIGEDRIAIGVSYVLLRTLDHLIQIRVLTRIGIFQLAIDDIEQAIARGCRCAGRVFGE